MIELQVEEGREDVTVFPRLELEVQNTVLCVCLYQRGQSRTACSCAESAGGQ